MGPGGSAFVVMLWVLAAVVFIAVVAAGARLGRATPTMFLARGGSVLAASLCLVLAMAGTMNAQYGWYTTWQDIWTSVSGGPTVQTVATHAGGRVSAQTEAKVRMAQIRVDDFTNRRYAVERSDFQSSHRLRNVAGPGGQYLTVRIPGLGLAAGRAPAKVLIWLPSSYTSPAERHRTYPVIEAFHGVPGSIVAYHNEFSARYMLGGAAARHRLANTILVAPDYTPRGIDTECVNGGGIDTETWITKTVPDWVIHHLRVQSAPGSWATLGFSAGGWCAAMATALHPKRFGSAILLGAYYHPIFGRQWVPYTSRTLPERYRLLDWITRHRPRVNLWVEVSDQDPLSGPASARLVREVKPPTSVTAVTLPYAGHRIPVWVSLMPEALNWLAHTEPAFAPAPIAS